MEGGQVRTAIYGGCNSSGAVSGVVNVNVLGGTLGTDADHTINIHGGGYGQATSTGNDVNVNIGLESKSAAYPTIWGDVFGGANAAYVDGDVTLTLKGGNSIDYVFGGSKSVADEDHVGGYAINGSVTLSGNAEIMGNVYGGGNKAVVEGNTGVKME